MSTTKDLIKDIASERKKGANELALQALEVVRSVALSSKAADAESLLAEIIEVLEELSECRPSMAIIKNSMRTAGIMFEDLKCSGCISTEHLRDNANTIFNKIIEDINTGKARSILNTVTFLNNFSVIATCSYSSTLVGIFKMADAKGKKIKLHILRSRSGDISYGEIMAEKLKGTGVYCQVYDDSVSGVFLDGADMVMLGSDTVFRDGSVLNGYPSLRLSKLASRHSAPVSVYIVSDSSKFSMDLPEHCGEPGFDLIPASLVDGLITEEGIFKGKEIPRYIEKKR
ncbi:MAG: hypothetical protein AB9844_10390 [Clostridiaceae bacterium]